ncbi:hypothetical protein [Fulvimarina sp. MAC3]|uniref:hypothetical protein n=1 Tax=Fulvimarina sp. MAC3 TaxID=3148887 RepID=UPI0031FD69D2
MNRSRLILAASFLAVGFSANPVFAQTAESGTPLPEQTLSDPAQSLTGQDDPIISNLVDVSLGDWDVRTEISKQLDIAISDVPLTIVVEPELASEICPVRDSDLKQQQDVSAVRTCAAKSVNDDLLKAVRSSVEQPESEGIDLGTASDGQTGSQADSDAGGSQSQNSSGGGSASSSGN